MICLTFWLKMVLNTKQPKSWKAFLVVFQFPGVFGPVFEAMHSVSLRSVETYNLMADKADLEHYSTLQVQCADLLHLNTLSFTTGMLGPWQRRLQVLIQLCLLWLWRPVVDFVFSHPTNLWQIPIKFCLTWTKIYITIRVIKVDLFTLSKG